MDTGYGWGMTKNESTDSDICLVCHIEGGPDISGHWETPLSAKLIGFTCSAEHTDLIEAAREDGKLTKAAVRQVRAAFLRRLSRAGA